MDAETAWAAGEARRYEEWLEACRQAVEFLEGQDPAPDPPTGHVTLTTGAERAAKIRDAGGETRTCRTAAEVLAHLAEGIHARLVRREGWTAPEDDGRIEPDSGSLVLNPQNPGVRLTAQIGIDGTWVEPRLEHTAADGTWRELPITKLQGLEHAARQMGGAKATAT